MQAQVTVRQTQAAVMARLRARDMAQPRIRATAQQALRRPVMDRMATAPARLARMAVRHIARRSGIPMAPPAQAAMVRRLAVRRAMERAAIRAQAMAGRA